MHRKVHSKVDLHSAHLLSISLPQHTRKSTLKSRLSFSTSTVDLLATTYTEKYTQKSTFIQHIYCRSPCHNIHGKVDFHSAHLLSISLPQHTRKSRLSFSTSTVDLLATTYTEKSTFIQHIYCRSPCHNIHGKVDFHSAHLLSISLPQHTRKSRLSFSTSTFDLLATTYTEKSTFIQHIYCRSPCHNIHSKVHSKVDFHSAHLLSISLPQHTRKSRLSFSTSTVDLLATTYTEKYTQKSTFIQHIYCRSPCHNIHGKVHSKVDFHSAHLLSISLPQHTRKSTLKSRLSFSTSTVDLLATTYTEKSTFIQHIYCRSPCHNIHGKVDFHSAHLLSISLPQHTRKSTLKSRLSFSTSTVDLLATTYTEKYTQKSTFIQHIYCRSPCHNIHGKVDFHSAHLLSISLPQHTWKSRPSFSTSTVDLLATTCMEKSTFIQHIYCRSPCHNIHGKVHSKVDFHSAHLLSISLPQHTQKSTLKSRLSFSTSTVDLLATTYTEKSTFIQHIYCRYPCHNIHGKVNLHSAHLLSISLPQHAWKSRLSFSTSTVDLLATTYTEKYTQKSTFIQHIYCRSPCHNIHGKVHSKVDFHSAHLLSISLPQHAQKSRPSFSTSTVDLLATTYTEK